MASLKFILNERDFSLDDDDSRMSNLLKAIFLVWASLIVCLGLRIPDLTKLVARLMSQQSDDAIPIGITDNLIRKWEKTREKIECRKQRDLNPQLARRMDQLVEISHINSFNCQQISSFVERIGLEQVLNETFLNINPYVKFMKDIQFNKCLYDFHARVNEILSRLSDESREIIERLAEVSNLSQTQDEILAILSKSVDSRLLNGRSELIPTSINELTRSYQMEVAIYMTNNIKTLYSHNHKRSEEQKKFFIQQYHRLIYETCDKIYDDLSQWLDFVLISSSLDGQQVNFQLNKDHSWGRFYTVCTILGGSHKEAHEHVYRYFIDYLDLRGPSKELTLDQTVKRFFFIPLPDDEQPSFITQLLPEPGLRANLFSIEPYTVLEYMKKLSSVDNQEVDMIIDLDAFQELKEMSNVRKDKCTIESLDNRLQQVEIIDYYGLNLENVGRYMHYFNDRQFKVCEANLYVTLSNLLRYINDQTLVRLEQLRRFVTQFSNNPQQRDIDQETFHKAVAAYFYLYKYPFEAPVHALPNLPPLLDETCSAFRYNTRGPKLISILSYLRIINDQLQVNPMVMNFLKYERLCDMYETKAFTYLDILRYLTRTAAVKPTSFREVWTSVSNKRSSLSMNWLKP